MSKSVTSSSEPTLPDVERRAAPSRRTAYAGALLTLGGLVLAASQIIQPRGGDEVFAVSLTEAPSRWLSWGLLLMATALLQLPAVVSLRALADAGTGARLSAGGGALTFVSLVAMFSFGLFHAIAVAVAGPTPISADLLAAFDRLNASVPLGITTLVALFGFHLGWPLLLAGAGRARLISAPLAIVGAASVFLSFFGSVLGSLGEIGLFVTAAFCLSLVGVELSLGRRPRWSAGTRRD